MSNYRLGDLLGWRYILSTKNSYSHVRIDTFILPVLSENPNEAMLW